MNKIFIPCLFFLLLSSFAFAQTVYINQSGSKYHKSSCIYLSSSKISIDLKEALEKGYTPCTRCKPDDTINANVENDSIYDVSDDNFVIDMFPSVDDSSSIGMPEKYGLHQNYPNPFNPITTIKYDIPEKSFTTLKVYDVLGNEIATLVNEEKPIGSYEIEFNANGLPGGVYFYRLQTEEFIETKKMIFLR